MYVLNSLLSFIHTSPFSNSHLTELHFNVDHHKIHNDFQTVAPLEGQFFVAALQRLMPRYPMHFHTLNPKSVNQSTACHSRKLWLPASSIQYTRVSSQKSACIGRYLGQGRRTQFYLDVVDEEPGKYKGCCLISLKIFFKIYILFISERLANSEIWCGVGKMRFFCQLIRQSNTSHK